MSKKYQFDEEEKQWLTYHTKNSLYILLKKERERTKNLQSQLNQANEVIKLMYKDLLETGEWQKSMAVYRKEAEKKLQELRGGE